jgi:hypothetical protein
MKNIRRKDQLFTSRCAKWRLFCWQKSDILAEKNKFL